MNDFSKIASHYEQSSILQKSASDELFDLIKVKETDDVLDLGCGTGHLTKKIREITRGHVAGIDAAPGMIEKAIQHYGQFNISFAVCAAEDFNYVEQFDVIFCNSTFQWFKKPEMVLNNSYRALRGKGRIGIQAPAREIYCPNFIEAVTRVQSDYRTKKTFAHFNPPWFLLETAEEYSKLFQKVGFEVNHSRIEQIVTWHTQEEVYDSFNSGASAGYLNQAHYGVSITEEYIETFKEIVKEAFVHQGDESGKVELVFFRIYLLAEKPC